MVKFHLDSIIFLSLCFYKHLIWWLPSSFNKICNLLGISKSCPHCIFQMYCVHSFHLVLFILITFCYGLALSTLIVNYVVGLVCFLFNFRIVFKISWCQFHAFYACDKRISFLVVPRWDGHGRLHFEFNVIGINRDLGNNWAKMNLDLKN
jgi:hypothetical protein